MYKCFGRSDQEGQRTDGHDDAQQFADNAEIGREEAEEDEDTDRHDQDTQTVREEVGTVLQATDPYEDDEDGYTDKFASEATEVARALQEGDECFLHLVRVSC